MRIWKAVNCRVKPKRHIELWVVLWRSFGRSEFLSNSTEIWNIWVEYKRCSTLSKVPKYQRHKFDAVFEAFSTLLRNFLLCFWITCFGNCFSRSCLPLFRLEYTNSSLVKKTVTEAYCLKTHLSVSFYHRKVISNNESLSATYNVTYCSWEFVSYWNNNSLLLLKTTLKIRKNVQRPFCTYDSKISFYSKVYNMMTPHNLNDSFV